MSRLAELLLRLDSLDDTLTIYAAEPWTCDSATVAVVEPADGSLPAEAAGLSYLLEIRMAKEALQVWSDWRGGRAPSAAERCAAVLHFAEYDAYLPISAHAPSVAS